MRIPRSAAFLAALFLSAPVCRAGDESGLPMPTFHLAAFGNVDLTTETDAGHSGFSNGALDLYMTSALGDDWLALAELVFEHDGSETRTDLERFQLSWQRSDALRITVGRIHDPLVAWNVTQHHGLFLQTPVDRPILARWEDEPGLWPAHFVGLYADGRFEGAVRPSWGLGVGNGRGEIPDEVQVGSDRNSSKAILVKGGVAPEAVYGLELSVVGYVDRIPAADGEIDERDLTLQASYRNGPVELRTEWATMHHRRRDGPDRPTWKTDAWYLLAGYRLSGPLEGVEPYVLAERLDLDEREEWFGDASDESAISAGIRWDLARFVALKLEFRSSRLAHETRENVGRLQAAFSF